MHTWLHIALLAALSLTPSITLAQEAAPEPLRLTPAQRALAFDMARVALNEAGTEEDLALIWQVVQENAASPRARHAFLRAHSRCVTGVLPQSAAMRRPGNCRWTRHLMRPERQVSPPQGYPDGALGVWPRVRARWRFLVQAAEEMVAGRRVLIVCNEAPTTWDGRRYGAETMRERGFEILDCKGTRNFGLRRRARSREDAARVASEASADENADLEGEVDERRDPRRVPAAERGREVAAQPEEA